MRAFIKTAMILILVYLVLINATGFSKDLATATKGTGELITDFQGR
jgi:translation elongation factor EF-G